MKSSSPKVHTPSTQSNKKFTKSNKEFIRHSSSIHEQFTQGEIRMIKEMLKSWQEVTTTTQTNKQSLYDRIEQLPQSDKTRKTIVIDRVIGKRLDEFCKNERINKSDVLHLALTGFLEKYEK